MHGKTSRVVKVELLGRCAAKCLCWPFLLPSLLHELLGTYICLTAGRTRRLRKGSQAPAPAFHTFQCSAASGVGWLWWEKMTALCCLLGNEWTGQHLPAPWLKMGCLMLLSDVVCTLPETLQLPDPKNREL